MTKLKKYHNKYIKISDKDQIYHYLSIICDYSFYLSLLILFVTNVIYNSDKIKKYHNNYIKRLRTHHK